MKYQIFKLENDGWILISEHSTLNEAKEKITDLRLDGNTYRCEARTGFIAQVLDI